MEHQTVLRDVVIVVLIAAWIVYWRISASGTKQTQRRESRGSRFAHLVPLLGGTLLTIVPFVPIPWLAVRVVPASVPVQWGGVALLALGLGFSAWARHHLGSNWSGVVTLKGDHELIRTGPYRWVRHPIYVGVIAALIGCVLAYGELRGILGVALVVIAMVRKLRIEERYMHERFKEEYARYRADTPALIPFVY
jgi:protein-S-isoprenylcysteine O-methyltransferase Ste14